MLFQIWYQRLLVGLRCFETTTTCGVNVAENPEFWLTFTIGTFYWKSLTGFKHWKGIIEWSCHQGNSRNPTQNICARVDVFGCVDILKLHSFLFLIKLQQLSARHFIKSKRWRTAVGGPSTCLFVSMTIAIWICCISGNSNSRPWCGTKITSHLVVYFTMQHSKLWIFSR